MKLPKISEFELPEKYASQLREIASQFDFPSENIEYEDLKREFIYEFYSPHETESRKDHLEKIFYKLREKYERIRLFRDQIRSLHHWVEATFHSQTEWTLDLTKWHSWEQDPLLELKKKPRGKSVEFRYGVHYRGDKIRRMPTLKLPFHLEVPLKIPVSKMRASVISQLLRFCINKERGEWTDQDMADLQAFLTEKKDLIERGKFRGEDLQTYLKAQR